MTYVSFMSNEHLLKCIKYLYDAYENTKSKYTLKKFYSNQIDPIKLLFDMKFFGVSEEEKISQEISRQIDKTISNHIGTFHELLIGGIAGYKAHKVGDGFDITDEQCEYLFADIKNKHNTVTGTHLYNLYVKLEGFLTDKKDAKAYYVQIISSNGSTLNDDENWKYSMEKDPETGKKFQDSEGNNITKVVKDNPNVYKVSADRFYEILTGNKNAFAEICAALPIAIDDFLVENSIASSADNSNVYRKLVDASKKNNVSVSTQLMNDTFKNYFGFPLKDDPTKQNTNNISYINTDHFKSKYTTVELFAGVGGLALGLEQAGFQQVCLIDINKDSCNILRKNRSDWNVIESDINNIAVEGINNLLGSVREIDLLSGSVPLQPFSYAGYKTKLRGINRSLFDSYSEILSQLRPKAFLLESAKGLLSLNSGNLLNDMLGILANVGYKVTWKILNSSNFNVAQNKERLIIVGIRNDLPQDAVFRFPTPSEQIKTLKDVLIEVPKSKGISYSKSIESILELIRAGMSFRNLDDEIKNQYANVKSIGLGMLERMSWDKPTPPLIGNPLYYCHPDDTRPFTIREYARIQGFPDTWKFEGSTRIMYNQISNSTPIGLAKAIGLEIRRYLDNITR